MKDKPMTAAEAQRVLGLERSSFWDLVHRLGVPHYRYGPRLARFDIAVVAELKRYHEVRTPADLARVADGRHRFSWSAAGGR